MKFNVTVGSAMASAVLASCATAGTLGPDVVTIGGNEAASVFEEVCEGGASPVAAICRGVDIVSTLTTLPSARSDITYSQTDPFDTQLHASMKGKVPEINVTFSDTKPTYSQLTQVPRRPAPDAQHLVFWQARVLNTGGNIVVCEISQHESIIAVLGSRFADALLKIADDWLTYRFAKDYNSMLIVSRTNSEEAPEYVVDRVHYRLRSNENSLECPLGTVQYAVLARPS